MHVLDETGEDHLTVPVARPTSRALGHSHEVKERWVVRGIPLQTFRKYDIAEYPAYIHTAGVQQQFVPGLGVVVCWRNLHLGRCGPADWTPTHIA